MMKAKILACAPLTTDCSPQSHENDINLPVGALSIASVLEQQGIEVEVVDLKFLVNPKEFDINVIVNEILQGPRVVGISLMVDGLPSVVKACEIAKKEDPDKIIVLGGPGPSPVAIPLMKHFKGIDIIVVGEGEKTAEELFPLLCKKGNFECLNEVAGIVYRNNGNVFATKPRASISNLDILPFPAFHLVDTKKYNRVGIITSRGCLYNCCFCSTSRFWSKKIRYKSAKKVIGEIKILTKKYNIQRLDFSDDNFTQSTSHVEEVCSLIQKENLNVKWGCLARVNDLSQKMLETLYNAGCRACAIGVESGSSNVLRSISKGFNPKEALQAILNADNFFEKIKLFFIWGFPFEKTSDLMQTVTFLRQTLKKISDTEKLIIGLSLASPLPQSQLFKEYCNQLFVDWDLYTNWGGLCGNKENAIQMEIKEIVEKLPEIFSNFYVFPQPDLNLKKRIVKSLIPPLDSKLTNSIFLKPSTK